SARPARRAAGDDRSRHGPPRTRAAARLPRGGGALCAHAGNETEKRDSDAPEEARLYAQTQATIQKITIGTHNALLTGFPGGDGIKTGYTCASGYNLVASATRNGRLLIAVILGESSSNARTARAAALLENG